MKQINLKNIKCSDCSSQTKFKNEYNEAVCEDCHGTHVKISNEIRLHEFKLQEENYFGYPEEVPMSQIQKIKIGDSIKQRGIAFLVK